MSLKKDNYKPLDKKIMNFAINLADNNKYLTGINPSVGCVIVKKNKILSFATTNYGGRPHAESIALNKNRYNINGFISNFRIFGNHVLTIISNFLNNQNLTDAHTCYKVFRKNIFLKLNPQENDFAFCPEVTTKLSLLSEKIIEIPISYKGRNIKEGKKIRFKDALRALITIIKYRWR